MSGSYLQSVDLLWTGGWDSTFRLLDVVLRHHVPVQPWYVIDRERASTERELETMQTVRRALAKRDARAAALVRASRFVERSSICPDAALDALHSESRLGSQYGWLPRFAKQHGLTGLELGSVRVEGGKMFTLLRDNVERVQGRAGETYRVGNAPRSEVAQLFARFEFPILMQSKADLYRQAVAGGFLDLMKLTWTCHTPKRGAPCGVCTPCLVMMRSGQIWRIPPARRVRPLLRIAKAAVQEHRRSATVLGARHTG